MPLPRRWIAIVNLYLAHNFGEVQASNLAAQLRELADENADFTRAVAIRFDGGGAAKKTMRSA